ncbi:MAG: MBL fold metallo-hydrolase [Lachnospiraceae bacterium]|nr:MBL fold metallo-hydrolase [Lachnospiraceae bacterium]
MIIKGILVGHMEENCYLAVNEDTKEAVIIDPGAQADYIKEKVLEEGAKPVAILLTHGHFDHTGAVKELREYYGIKAYANEKEKEFLENLSMCLSKTQVKVDDYFSDMEVLLLAGFQIQAIWTPGHTPGGTCFYFVKEKVLFSGDSLFQESVGRSDLPGGSMGSLITSIKEKLFLLDDDVVVYPGHMDVTTIGHEKQYNFFIKMN